MGLLPPSPSRGFFSRGFWCHVFLTLPINLLCPQIFVPAAGVQVPSFPDFRDNFNTFPNFCPGISPGPKWWPTVLGKRNCIQPMGRLSMHSCWALFFPFGSGVGWAEFFFVFFFSYSECVPKRFSTSQSVLKCIPQNVPSSTWVLSHMVCTKFNSYV
jgi:hypothetical protein